MPVSFEEAVRFFDQLREFSGRYLERINCPPESPWGQPAFQGGAPRGAVLHFTDGEDLDRTLKWFTRERYNARVSAHAVLARYWTDEARALARDLPLVLELPTLVVQCRRPSQAAVHATWANALTYGVELVNPGIMPAGDEKAVEAWGRLWEPYTVEQLHTVVGLLRRVRALHQESLQASWIAGHEQFQGVETQGSSHRDKRDPGPLFPLEDVRAEVLDDGPAGVWLEAVGVSPRYAVQTASHWVTTWEDEHGELVIDALGDWITVGPFGSLGKLLLRVLGYHVVELATDELLADDLETVWIFQRMAGLRTDRDPGPRTRRAVVDRLTDRGFFPEK